ncbi:MAG: PAS domain-containing protein, partial [Chloroflexota bacterium]
EYVFHRDDGTDVWLLAHGMAERDAEGRVIGFRGTAQDVTQRKRAELELQATQQQFRRMLDELVEGAVLLDHAWRLRYVNPALTTLPPSAPNPALGMSLFELVPGIRETELFARLARCVAEGVADRFEAQVELPPRPPRWYEVSAQPRPEGLFVLLMDVTERHDAIAAIRDRSEHLSRHAADLEDAGQLAGLGLWRRDLRTRTTTWSPEMFAMFGFDPAAGPPDPATLDAMITPETRAARDHAAAAGVAAGVPWEVELCMRLPDGAVRWILQRGSATLDPDGEIVAYRGTAIDITERKQLEQDLRRFNEALERRVVERTAELEAAVEELRSFSYTVSHDLRAPVRAVAGFARILERDHAEQLDASGLHRLDNIRVAAEAMGRLIDDLLAYTRVGRAAVRRESVHLDPIMARLESTFGARVREAGGSLVISGPMGTPMGDPTLVEEMLVNLVDNAITYRRPDVAPVVAVCASVRGDRVRLAVSDNGRGIPPESQERIFEVFHRLSPSEGDVGTGIGLAIVRKAARSMGAEVAVESVVGEGSTFSVSLPIAPDPEA